MTNLSIEFAHDHIETASGTGDAAFTPQSTVVEAHDKGVSYNLTIRVRTLPSVRDQSRRRSHGRAQRIICEQGSCNWSVSCPPGMENP
jgi:hypothetical protein